MDRVERTISSNSFTSRRHGNPRVAVDLQYASAETPLPIHKDIHSWVVATLTLLSETANWPVSEKQSPSIPSCTAGPYPDPNARRSDPDIELTVRVVDEEEGLDLNWRYRDREKATNVLSFPCEVPDLFGLNLLGDIVVCAPVVKREADRQHKNLQAHWAHMVVHGTLHLLGFDHISREQAVQMESLETAVLAHLGFPDPYHYDER
uniref:Endoribonuclease YbeY n=1 Tax=Candidatus Kentrum eta TaxID=2126337 RepID=A0A450VDS7_9GAMM|nr:MAG: rRNA maturation RNase YbeY [Candidatus Kentron sp. H]VFJ97662.1 MAG: rRNA maturation RNase YbeY [Candidatus Kentron sp. H]VFK02924.1 MAG: rRNA maturation RNase YbeY [Candidatus Kentron sp. H]